MLQTLLRSALYSLVIIAVAGCSPPGATYNEALAKFKAESEALDRLKLQADAYAAEMKPQVEAIDKREEQQLNAVTDRWSGTQAAKAQREVASKGPAAYRDALLTEFFDDESSVDPEIQKLAAAFLAAFPQWAAEMKPHVMEAAKAHQEIDDRYNPKAERLLGEMIEQQKRVNAAKVLKDSLAPVGHP